LISRRLTVS